MFSLRSLAFSLLITSFAMFSNTGNAQEYWNTRRNSNCGQSNGYPTSGMPSLRRPMRSYGDYPTYDSRRFLPDRSDLQPHSPLRHFPSQSMYNDSAPSAYRDDHRQMTWQGSSLSGYPNRNAEVVYDSMHGDYHAVPRLQSHPASTGHAHGHSPDIYREQFLGPGW